MSIDDFPSIATLTDEQVVDCLEGVQDGSITDVTIVSLIVNLRRCRDELDSLRLTRPPSPKLRRRYPWGEMAVGDSFLVAGADGFGVSAVAVMRAKSHPGEKYTTRKEPDGIRVWRIA